MSRWILVAGICVLLAAAVRAEEPGRPAGQPANPIDQYRVEPLARGMTPLTGTTTQVYGPGSHSSLSDSIDLPFSFSFSGTACTKVKISPYGAITFDEDASYLSSANDLSTTWPQKIVAAFWDDLDVAWDGKIHYQTVGAAPSRRFVVEYLRADWSYSGGRPCSFQIRLAEGSNDIEFHYGDWSNPGSGVNGASIGITDGEGRFINALDGSRQTPQNNIMSAPPFNYRITTSPAPAKDIRVSRIQMDGFHFIGVPGSVVVTLENPGSQAQSGFPVAYRVGGGPVVRENFAGSLPAGGTAGMTFAAPYIPAAAGTFDVSAWTELSGDAIPLNDGCIAEGLLTVYQLELPPPAGLQASVNGQNRFALTWQPGAFTRPLPGPWHGTSQETYGSSSPAPDGPPGGSATDREEVPVFWEGITAGGELVEYQGALPDAAAVLAAASLPPQPVAWTGRDAAGRTGSLLTLPDGEAGEAVRAAAAADPAVYLQLNLDGTKLLQIELNHTIGGETISPITDATARDLVKNRFRIYWLTPWDDMSVDVRGTFTPPAQCSGIWRRGVYINNIYNYREYRGTWTATADMAPPQLAGWRVYRSENPGVALIPANLAAEIGDPAATGFTDLNLVPQPCKPYYYTVVAVYDSGVSGPSAETGPSSCGITVQAPNGGETWQKTHDRVIQWQAPGLTGDVSIGLYKNHQLARNLTSQPAGAGSWSWNLPQDLADGTDYQIKVSQGAVQDDSNGFFAITPDYPPVVEITAPDGTRSLQGTVLVQAEATDDIGVSRVEFYWKSQLVQTVTSPPFSFNWDTTLYKSESGTLSARAYDTRNQQGNTFNLGVWLYNRPGCTLNGPAGNTVAGTVEIQATATGRRPLVRVEFYVDDQLLALDATAPYSFLWDTTQFPDGWRMVKAIAVDSLNETSFDAKRQWQVANLAGVYPSSSGITGVHASGGLVYATEGGAGLWVIDAADPAAPEILGFCPTPGSAAGVRVAGPYAYVADGAAGLRIINIANPQTPVETGFCDTPGNAGAVAVSGTMVYVADGAGGLRIINVSNPAAPVEAGSYTAVVVNAVSVTGSHACLTSSSSRNLHVVDVSNPAAPAAVSVFALDSTPLSHYPAGNLLYVAAGGLKIIDLGNPAVPVQIGGYSRFYSASGITVNGEQAFLAERGSGLLILDIAGSFPSWVSSVDTPGSAVAVSVDGGYAYVADLTGGLRIIRLAPAPAEAGSLFVLGNANGVWVDGGRACLAAGISGLRVLDVTVPLAPRWLGGADTPGTANWVHTAGHYAYVADGEQGLQIYDISDPATPPRTGFSDTPGNALGVFVAGNYAYVADDTAGLQIVNITNPNAPVLAGTLDTSGNARAVWTVGGYAYIADGSGGLRIINVSNPAAPVEVASLPAGSGNARGLWIAGNRLYLTGAGNTNPMSIIDIGNPAAPVSLGTGITYQNFITVAGSYAYTTSSGNTIRFTDIRDPANPAGNGDFNIPGTSAAGLFATGEYVYIAAGTGLTVIPALPEPPSNLQVTVGGTARLDLTWQDHAGNERWFQIERKTGTGGWLHLVFLPANSSSYQDASVSGGSNYTYRVRAVNVTGRSGYSNEAIGSTIPPPAAPSNLRAMAVSESRIDLTWQDNSDNETAFWVERQTVTAPPAPDSPGTAAAGEWEVLGSLPANTTSCYSPGLTPSTTYRYRVRAANSTGYSAYSNEAEATTPSGIPAAPSNLQATATSSRQIVLNWQDNSNNETGFHIERKEPGSGSSQSANGQSGLADWQGVGWVPADTTAWTDDYLQSSTVYLYRVMAANGTIYSGYSNEATATTLLDIPDPPDDLRAEAVSSTSIALSWSDRSRDEEGFRIERRTGSSGSWSEIATTVANATAFTDSGLTADTRYYYRVRAWNTAGMSPYSNDDYAVPPSAAPAAPSLLTALPEGTRRIRLNWRENSSNESGFRIERRLEPAGAWGLLAVSEDPWFADLAVAPDTLYRYRVQAVNILGSSSFSNEATARTYAYDAIIPAAAHTGGVGGTTWRSDVDLVNAGWEDGEVEIALLRKNQANLTPVTANVIVPANRAVRLLDVLAETFTESNAALGFRFDNEEIKINSRFYNVSASCKGTFGMYIPAFDNSFLLPGGRQTAAVFHHLSNEPSGQSGYRTNLGFTSACGFALVIKIILYGDDGQVVGQLTFLLQPFEHRQITKIHDFLKCPPVNHGHAVVQVLTAGGLVHAYAMLIDNISGDPVYIWPDFISTAGILAPSPQLEGAPSGDGEPAAGPLPETATAEPGPAGEAFAGGYEYYIPAAAHVTGANTVWRTDVDLCNVWSQPAVVEFSLLKLNQSNLAPLTATVNVPAGQTVRVDDILGTLFNFGNAGLGVRFQSGRALVNARFYNAVSPCSGGTFGMYIPAADARIELRRYEQGIFHFVGGNAGFRTNVGFVNSCDKNVEVVIEVYGDDGQKLAEKNHTLLPFEHRQFSSIHRELNCPVVEAGYIIVKVLTSGGLVHPYVMLVDNRTGDPVYMPVTKRW